MKDVFDNETPLEEVIESQGAPEGQHVEHAATGAETNSLVAAATPAAESSKQVPLQALEAERTKRREWRDKFQHLQGQFDAMQRMQQSGQAQAPNQGQQQPQFQDPAQRFAYEAIERSENSRFDTSEMLAREKFGDELVDKAFQHVTDVNDPTVWSRIKAAKHPWAEVVKESKRLEILGQMGDDPLTYEQKLKEKWLAETNPAAPGAVRTPPPASLAGSRSSAGRTTSPFTGPTPIKDLFN